MRRVAPVHLLSLALVGCGAEHSDSQAASSSQPIVGGYVDSDTSGVVGLGIDFRGRFFAGHCSGTLIAPNLVLTARHCVAMTTETADEGVVCGDTAFGVQGDAALFLASPQTQRPLDPHDRSFFRGAEIRVPPGANDICGFDIALIVLEGAGMPADIATPITPRIDRRPTSHEQFSASGFGLTSPEGLQDGVRMRTDGNTVSCAGVGCGDRAGRIIKDTEWLSNDARVCPGDSGGPALDLQGRVIGVASRGTDGCGAIIYGDVAAWGEFIIDVALDAAESGRYSAPFWTRGSSIAPERDLPDAGAQPDLLGSSCDGPCGSGFSCWTETGEPPGICVPRCGDDSDCDDDYFCDDDRSLCLPEGSKSGPIQDEGACAVRPGGSSGSIFPAALTLFAMATWVSRRRPRGASRSD